MGDRGNIKIVSGFEWAPPLYFYTHWRGSELPGIVSNAMKRVKNAGRLTDESYASRIIFDTLTENEYDESTGYCSTGYGISTWRSEDASTVVTIDFKDKTVDVSGMPIPFDIFVALDVSTFFDEEFTW